MARKKKPDAREQDELEQKTKKEASVPKMVMLKCHKCRKDVPMSGVLCIQNDGPLCRECGDKL